MKIAVIGGGIRGCIAARAARRAGAEVVLLETRQLLGREFSGAGREWVKSGKSEVMVQPGSIAKSLLAEQLELGTRVLLNAQAGGILTSAGKAAGVLVADAYGTQLLAADAVIDTEGTLLADIPAQTAEVRYSFVTTGMTPMFLPEIPAPEKFGLTGNVVRTHLSVRPNCAVIELRRPMAIDAYTAKNPNRALPAMQRLAAEVYTWLRANHPAFAEAGMHNLLHNEAELCGLTITQTAAPAGYLVPATALPEPFASTSLRDMAEDLAAEVRAFLAGITPAGRPDAILTASGSIDLADCEAYDDPAVAFRDGTALQAVKLPAEAIPVRERVSVFVAGGGTSGIQTLEALRDRGVSAAMAELCAMPGGTRNLGMVMGYWHGHKTGRNAALDVIADAAEKTYKIASNGANILTQNAALAPMEEHFYFNTVVCGAIRDGRTVKSLILCDGGGLFRADADIFVDATGDAVAAYLAGAAYMHGDPRDGNVQTYSQWGENLWRSGSFLENRYHGDHDIIDLDSWEDCLRGMYLGQHDNSDIRYSPLLTVREGRRVVGDYVLTMDDIWDETIFGDTVAVTLTPFDTHGKGSALYCDMGLTSLDGKELRARIPWRCYIARDLDNLLITAKAYSATRDANSIGRMNADLRHAGYAVGLGAAEAILTNKSVRAIDLAPVQAELKAQGILPEWTFEPLEIPATEKLCELANAGDAEAILVLYRTTDPARIAEIAEMWEKHPEDPLTLRLASWHELPGATEAAAAKLCALMDANPGGKIENYALARQLAASLTHADALSPELLAPVIERACAGGDVFYPPTHRYHAKIYGYDRVDGWKVPHFGMLYLLAQAAERHADAMLAAPLEALLAKQYIGGYVLRGGEAPEAPFMDHGISPIFCALLELRIAAAAARCGSDRGAELLRDYAEEDRSILRKFAKKELAAVTSAGGICPCTEPLTLR